MKGSFFFYFFLLASPTSAQKPPEPRPHVVLVLCDALTIDDLRNPAYPALYDLAQRGAVGLMNGATAGARTPTAEVLTLALGQQQQAEPTDELAYRLDEPAPQEQGTAADAYARRTGISPPTPEQIVQLGLASLARRRLNAVTLGAVLAAAEPPVHTLFCGNADTDAPGRRAALLTLDRQGLGRGDPPLSRRMSDRPFGRTDADPNLLARYAAESDANLFVIQFGDTARAEAARSRISPTDYRAARSHALHNLDLFLMQLVEDTPYIDLLLISPYPPTTGGQWSVVSHQSPITNHRPPTTDHQSPFWSRLTPILAYGPHFAPGLLTSPTTRTAGLVANIDVAPTLLALFQVAPPVEMIGRTMRSTPDGDGPIRLATLARMDYVANLNARAVTEVTVPLGGVLFVIGIAGLIVRRTHGVRAARRFAPVMVVAQNLPAALMLAPLMAPPTLLEYGLRIAAWMAALAAACCLLARPLRTTPPVVAALLLILLVMGDTLAGQPLVKDSLLSGYALSGIRYYGVGNEYLGTLLGMALAGGFAWLDDLHFRADHQASSLSNLPDQELQEGTRRRLLTPNAQRPTPNAQRPLPLLVLWLLLALDLGWPGLGANAGSVIVTTAGFGVGAAILHGRRPTLTLAMGCTLAGLALSFGLGALDAALAGRNASHAGVALNAAAHGRGVVYLAQIAARKAAMNLRLLFAPYLLLGAGVVAATVVAARALIGREIAATLGRRPWTARSLPALLAAIASSLLFKDSGVVAAIFLIGSAAVILLWYVMTEEEAQKPNQSA